MIPMGWSREWGVRVLGVPFRSKRLMSADRIKSRLRGPSRAHPIWNGRCEPAPCIIGGPGPHPDSDRETHDPADAR